jgi:RNA polymerase sigma-70 factor (ECF subfamily)
MAAASMPVPGDRLLPAWDQYADRIQAREERALSELYDRTSRLVYSLALRILSNTADAEEVVCDVYAQIWKGATAFDRARGTYLSWILLITRSRALDRLRSRQPRESSLQPLDEFLELHAPEPDAEASTQLAQRRGLIRAALHELSSEQRELIELAYFGGLSHSELADRTGLPLGTVKTRIRMGMMKLKERLTPQKGAL